MFLEGLAEVIENASKPTPLSRLGLADWSDIEPLFDKVINTPEQITPEEKHRIAQWPPREVMEANCQKHLKKSVDRVIKLAATDRESLTYAEARMIHEDFNVMNLLDASERSMVIANRLWTQKDLTKKHDRALELVLTPLELQAVQAVHDGAWFNTDRPGWPNMRDHFSKPAEWMQKIIDQGENRAWGYVIYCAAMDDSEEWERFREEFKIYLGSLPGGGVGAEEIRHNKVIEMRNHEGAEDDIDSLRRQFRALRDEGNVKPGLLNHLFLYVDSKARDTWNGPSFPWIWVIDPDWTLDRPDEDGYDGLVPVSWFCCYKKFYNFMSLKRFTLKEIWLDWKEMQKEDERPQPGWIITKLDKPKWPLA